MPSYAVILPAAGKSTRFSAQQRKKPFVELKGRAVWLRAAEVFVGRDDVVQMLIVVSPDDVDWFKDKFRPNLAFMDLEIVEGGAERADSVQNALARVRSDVDFVAVHDAARPLIVGEWVDAVFAAAAEHGAALPALPISSTVKRVEHGAVVDTVDRSGLYLAQTPQVFRRELLLDAFAQRGDLQPTDECQLVERLGQPIHVIPGWPMNIKITTHADFKTAQALVNALPKPSIRTLHPFAEEEPRLL